MVVDHGIKWRMDTLPISKFKATCLAALERVRKTRRPLRITRFGRPIADIVPAAAEAPNRDWFGCMAGTLEMTDDLIAAVEVEWEVMKK